MTSGSVQSCFVFKKFVITLSGTYDKRCVASSNLLGELHKTHLLDTWEDTNHLNGCGNICSTYLTFHKIRISNKQYTRGKSNEKP